MDADAWIRDRTWLGEPLTGTPQALTGTDPEAIRAVEALYAAIILIGGADTRRDAHRPPVQVSPREEGIGLSSSVTDTTVTIGGSGVTIGPSTFKTTEARRLFDTLRRIVAAADAEFAPQGTRMTQYRTPDYATFTRIEFGYGTPVIALEGRSNDGDGHREYTLDVIHAADSLLWNGATEGQDAG